MAVQNSEQRRLAAIMFTDMVGSTQLKQDWGDREALALIQRHHAIVRDLLRQFDQGEEISTAGDSFFLVFGNPSDAVRFALSLQAKLRALAQATPRPVFDRIGIHVGEVFIEAGEESARPKDLHGIQVDTCSRLMSLAKANQILMTRSVFDNARQVLRGQDIAGVGPLAWMNHGPYLLKGVEEPLEICEVGEASLGPLTPPSSSEKARRHVSDESEPVLGWRPALEQVVPGSQWLLERKLGEGGFGEVWLGRHETLKERRVFKFCFRADRVRSLKREVTLFRLLKEKVGQHPNIVGIQEVFFDAPPFYIVMDYAEATDLRAWCEAQGGAQKLPLATRLEIVAQVADALQAAHEAGVIHRDVKPSNILVSNQKSEIRNQNWKDPQLSTFSPQPSVKLTDFGIGQVVSQEAMAGMTRMGFTQTMLSPGSSSQTGTHLYMAPELLAGRPASIRSDIYSLGVVLYQLLIGDFSHPLTTDWDKRIDDPLLREDLEKCFAGNPGERFVSAGQLAKNLRSLEARQVELTARERVAQRRKLLTRAAVGVSALVALGALLVLGSKSMAPNKAAPPAATKTIVVVPFRGEGLDPSEEYLADSLATELINGVRKVPGLNAIRPPAFVASNSMAEIRLLYAAQPNVPLLLEGSLRKAEGQLRISARLTRTAEGSELLSPQYDRQPTDTLGIPNLLTRWLADNSDISNPAVQKRIGETPTQNPMAYDFYLRGTFANRLRPIFTSYDASIQLLERAVELDPQFALAHAALATAYINHYFYYNPEEASRFEKKAANAIDRALRLDENLPEAYFARGYFLWAPSQKWKHVPAIRELRHAVALNPNMEEAHIHLALIYLHVGLLEEGRELARQVANNIPLNPIAHLLAATVWFWQGQDTIAVQTRRAIPKEIGFHYITDSYMAVALINLGQTNDAVHIMNEALKADPEDRGGLYTSVQAILLAKQGDRAGARAKIEKAREHRKNFGHFHHTAYNIAAALALLNDPNQAINALREVAADGFPCYPFFQSDRNLNNLRQNPDFKAFLAEQEVEHERIKAELGKQSPPAAHR